MEPNTVPSTSVLTTLTTAAVSFNPSVITSCTTFTELYPTTISATRGQTIVVNSPSPPLLPTSATTVPTTKIYPDYQPTIISTTTATEIDIYLQSAGSVYSTWTIPLSVYPPQVTTSSGQLVYVVETNPDMCTDEGWDCWSNGAKAGLIIGVVFAAAFLLWGLVWCLKGSNEWIAHDWRWARGVEGNVVPTVHVPGPLDPRLAAPYGYGPGAVAQYGGGYGQYGAYPGWGYLK